jgi:hypothetical protein
MFSLIEQTAARTNCLGLICVMILRIDSPSDRPSKSIKRMFALISIVSIVEMHFVGGSYMSNNRLKTFIIKSSTGEKLAVAKRITERS